MLNNTESSAQPRRDTTTIRYTLKYSEQLRIEFVYQPTGALNKIGSMTSIYLLHVLATGCHLQGIFQIKVIQSQHVNLGAASLLLE